MDEFTTIELVVTRHSADRQPVEFHQPLSPVQVRLLSKALEAMDVPDELADEVDGLQRALGRVTVDFS